MRTIPSTGYILPKWEMTEQYRATAIAYMKREKVDIVENKNGKKYDLEELVDAATSYTEKAK